MTFQSWWWKVIYLHWTVVLRNWNREHGDRNQGKYKTIYIRQSFKVVIYGVPSTFFNNDDMKFKNLLHFLFWKKSLLALFPPSSDLNLRIALIYLIDLQKNVDLFYFKNLLSRWLFYFYLLSRVQILQLIGGWEFKKLLIGQGRNMFQAFLFYEETTFFMQFFFILQLSLLVAENLQWRALFKNVQPTWEVKRLRNNTCLISEIYYTSPWCTM